MSYFESKEAHNSSAIEGAHFRDLNKDGEVETLHIAENPPLTGDSLADGAGEGAISGGIVGGAMGVLASILVPGVGPTIAGGVLGTILAAVSLGAVAGGIIGALVRADDLARQSGAIAAPELVAHRFWEGEDRRGRMPFDYAGPERRFSFS